MWLAIAVLGLFGRRRAAFAVLCAYVALTVALLGAGAIRRLDVPAFLLLGVATLGRFPAPRARPFVVAMIPVSAALWLAGAALDLHGPLVALEWLAVVGVVALSCAVAGRVARPAPA